MTGTAFGRALAARRQARGLSQSRLAERAGCDHSYISRLESGQRMPARDAVDRLARVLDCSDDDKDVLLIAAGFLPVNPVNLLSSPLLGELNDEHRDADEVTRAWLDDGVRLLLAGARARCPGAHIVALRERETA